MHLKNKLCLYITLLCLAPAAYSNDKGGWIDEVRAGVLSHDVGRAFEKGQDINAELLFKSPKNAFFDFIWSPRPHLGASINVRGATSQFYGGLTWQWAPWEWLFFEASFGGEVHNGKTSERSALRKALGTRLLFRESIAVGVVFKQKHTLSVMLDHSSNASLANDNPGLTNLGLRYGYRF